MPKLQRFGVLKTNKPFRPPVTLGMADILASRRIRLYCNGGNCQCMLLRVVLMAGENIVILNHS